jgi:hypothetical protein
VLLGLVAVAHVAEGANGDADVFVLELEVHLYVVGEREERVQYKGLHVFSSTPACDACQVTPRQ